MSDEETERGTESYCAKAEYDSLNELVLCSDTGDVCEPWLFNDDEKKCRCFKSRPGGLRSDKKP